MSFGRRQPKSPSTGRLAHFGPVAVLLVAALSVTTFGPQVAALARSGLQHNETPTFAAQPPNSVASVLPSTSAPPRLLPEPSVLPTSPSVAQAASAVEVVQVVPPLRDVLVRVDGVALASDALGRISIPEDHRNGTIEIVGRDAEPVVQQVTFMTWEDGATTATRSLNELAGPVAQIGFSVASRVVVNTNPSVPDANVTFSSQAGEVTLQVGQPQWLVGTRATKISVAPGFTLETLTYTSLAISEGAGAQRALKAQLFVATPEVLWTVQS